MIVKNGFLIDLNLIEDKLKKDSKIKAIIPMHYGGELNDMSNIFSIADKYGLFVLEDAAHSLENSIFNKNYNYHDHAIAFLFMLIRILLLVAKEELLLQIINI